MIFLIKEPNSEGLTDCYLKEQGNSLFHLGHYDDALKAFDRAIELNPNDSESWVYKGVILKNLGRIDDALKACDNAIELDLKNSRAWEIKGIVLDYMGRTDDALKAYDRAIKFNPKNSGIWLNKGDTLSHMCQEDNAIVAYKRAIELDPKNSRAIDALKKLVNTKPDNVFSRPFDKNKESTNNEIVPTKPRKELKNEKNRYKNNAKKYFLIILVCATLCALITLYGMRDLVSSVFIFFVVFISLLAVQHSSSCSNCGNVNGISLDDIKLIDTKQSQKKFTKQEIVATSVRRIVATSDRNDRDAKVTETIKHYEGVNYLKTTTTKTYEKIYVCKYCGATSKKQYQTKSSKISRL
jgi:tetratricopeptide (TPR) repeat protein